MYQSLTYQRLSWKKTPKLKLKEVEWMKKQTNSWYHEGNLTMAKISQPTPIDNEGTPLDRQLDVITATTAGEIFDRKTPRTCPRSGILHEQCKPLHRVNEEGRNSTWRPTCVLRFSVTFYQYETFKIIMNRYKLAGVVMNLIRDYLKSKYFVYQEKQYKLAERTPVLANLFTDDFEVRTKESHFWC